ncbi:MAG: hypothetical protein ACLSGB_03105 [Dorea sp.]
MRLRISVSQINISYCGVWTLAVAEDTALRKQLREARVLSKVVEHNDEGF